MNQNLETRHEESPSEDFPIQQNDEGDSPRVSGRPPDPLNLALLVQSPYRSCRVSDGGAKDLSTRFAH